MKNKKELIEKYRDSDFETRLNACFFNDIDFEDLLTDAEIEDINTIDDYSIDHHLNLPQISKLEKINKLAYELAAVCDSVTEVTDYEILESELSAKISLKLKTTSCMNAEAIRIISEMNTLSDLIIILSLSKNYIYYTFTVDDVWVQ